jgi:hypothetical protein
MTGAENLNEISQTYGIVLNQLYGSTYKVFFSGVEKPEFFDNYRGWPISKLVRKLYSEGIIKNNVRAIRNG